MQRAQDCPQAQKNGCEIVFINGGDATQPRVQVPRLRRRVFPRHPCVGTGDGRIGPLPRLGRDLGKTWL